MNDKILVLGATGNVGTPLTQILVAKGEKVKAASRSGNPVEGAEGVVFDFLNPETFAPAFEDVNRVYVLLPAGYVQAKQILTPIIEFAAARKIKVVLQTALGVDADDAIPFRQVELALQNSGTPFVILRPNWFADNFHTFWKAGIDLGQIAVPAADGKSSFIDIRDIAASAAAALTSSRFDGQAFNLTGSEAFSYQQAAGILSTAIDKPINYTPINDQPFIEMLENAGVPGDYAAFICSIFYPVRQGWTAVITDDVEKLTGSEPRSLHTYVADHLPALAN